MSYILLLTSMLGFILFVISIMALKSIDLATCPKGIKNGWVAILSMSLCIFTATFTPFICNKDKKCTEFKYNELVYYLILVISILFFIISIFMVGEYNNTKNDFDNGKSKNYVFFIIGLSLVSIISTGLILFFENNNTCN